jgi:hypothetical protein
VIAHVLKLLARDEHLRDAVIAERAGCSRFTVWQLRRGEHRSQRRDARGRLVDRRGSDPRKVRLALRLLARPAANKSRIARRLGLGRRVVQLLALGQYITQKG